LKERFQSNHFALLPLLATSKHKAHLKQTLQPIQLKQNWEKKLADIHTLVGLYLKLRDRFPQALLLESADYHGKENAMSYICLEPWAEFKVENEKVFLDVNGQKMSMQLNRTKKISYNLWRVNPGQGSWRNLNQKPNLRK
jgi:anthranilate/para-aminobenzoate synthase component I